MVLTRYLANIILLIGHTFLLYGSQEIGIIIKTTGALMLLLSFIKLKMYDMIVILVTFSALELTKLFHLLFIF
jgi:hypothetical protein